MIDLRKLSGGDRFLIFIKRRIAWCPHGQLALCTWTALFTFSHNKSLTNPDLQ